MKPPVVISLSLICLIQSSFARVAAEEVTVSPVTVLLIDERDISASDAGLIEEMDLVEGSSVNKSQRIVSLNSDEQALAVDSAEISLEAAVLKLENQLAVNTAKAALDEARTGRGRIEAAMKMSKQLAEDTSLIEIAEADKDAASVELGRAEKAKARNRLSVSESEINQLRTQARKTELQVQKADSDRVVARLQPLVHQAELDERDASILRFELLLQQEQENTRMNQLAVRTMEKEVERAKLLLERRFVRAPIGGVIGEVHRKSGEWVEKGTVIATIVNLERLRVEGLVDTRYSKQQLVGSSVVIRFPDITDDAAGIPGVVTHVVPKVDPINQKIRIWAEFDNPELRILPGMAGHMTLVLKTDSSNQPAAELKTSGG